MLNRPCNVWYRFHLWVNRVGSWFYNVPFHVKLWYYRHKYGGGENIPQHIVNDLMGPVDDVSARVIKVAGRIDQLADVLQIDMAELTLSQDLSRYINQRPLNQKRKAVIEELLQMSDPTVQRRRILTIIEADGDVAQHKWDFFKAGVDEWLNQETV